MNHLLRRMSLPSLSMLMAPPRKQHRPARRLLSMAIDQALTHHYAPSANGADIPLYAGDFRLAGTSDVATGAVSWQWGRSAHIVVDGERDARFADPVEWLQETSPRAGSLWIAVESIEVALHGVSIPSQPRDTASGSRDGRPQSTVSLAGRHTFSSRIEQELGDPNDLERVTFLVPNGWQADDATALSAEADAAVSRPTTDVWHGRTSCTGNGWEVRFDQVAAMAGDAAWRELDQRGGLRFTHIGELRRRNGSTFTGDEAFHVLDRVRIALNIALGRRVSCALPVGYRRDQPVWTRWRTAPIDRFSRCPDWVDRTIAAQQIGVLVGRVLDATADAGRWGALRTAAGYYTTANDVTVDLTVPLPVSGLQALSYHAFSTSSVMSNTEWRNLRTEGQVRWFLKEAKIDLSVPPHLQHLKSARSRLSAAKQAGDALTAIIAMRNVATHPTDQLPYDSFGIYEWAEAGMLARYWLCLSLLSSVGYNGKISRRLEAEAPMLGRVKNPPWVQPRAESR